MTQPSGLPVLLESMRVLRGTLPLLPRHVVRLNDASQALKLLPPPADLVAEAESHGMRPPADRVVRIRWDGASLLWDDRDLSPAAPMRVAVVPEPHPGYPHKTDQRAAFERARSQAHDVGAEEPLLLTSRGFVAECAEYAVAWLAGGALRLPGLALGILPSVGRARLLEVAGEQGLEIESGTYGVEVLRDRPVLLVNAVRGVVPVVSLDGDPVPSDDRVGALADAFWPSA